MEKSDWSEFTTMVQMYLITLGVEKNDDTSKRNYFSSNKHEFPVEIIRNDYRLNELQRGVWGHSTCVREKRPYCKRDTDYWEGGRVEFKLSGSGNERRLKLLLKSECISPILVSSLQTSSFKSYTPLKLFTCEPALFRATPLYMETSSSKSYPFTKDSTLCEHIVMAC